MIHTKNFFNFLLRINCYYVHYVGDHNKNIYFFISTLHSPRCDNEKEIMIFLPIATTFTTPWFWQKNIFLLLLLHSLSYGYDKKKANYFSFQHYFHYTVIMRIKYYFAITTTFTTPWSWQEIKLFSFQHYRHYTIVMRKMLQYCFPQEVKFSVLKGSCMIQ